MILFGNTYILPYSEDENLQLMTLILALSLLEPNFQSKEMKHLTCLLMKLTDLNNINKLNNKFQVKGFWMVMLCNVVVGYVVSKV
jgi:hypothetical protein